MLIKTKFLLEETFLRREENKCFGIVKVACERIWRPHDLLSSNSGYKHPSSKGKKNIQRDGAPCLATSPKKERERMLGEY